MRHPSSSSSSPKDPSCRSSRRSETTTLQTAQDDVRAEAEKEFAKEDIKPIVIIRNIADIWMCYDCKIPRKYACRRCSTGDRRYKENGGIDETEIKQNGTDPYQRTYPSVRSSRGISTVTSALGDGDGCRRDHRREDEHEGDGAVIDCAEGGHRSHF
uniref:Uncharacterized protein n=1 Tax=Odontella aurita TaxID=265563 RepID=A0A7S4NDJ8_9STRA|mmetsp:Transcript_59235/g.176035  ORF Transcript_59235/g.176035 Transcript_59235/m.176035 type:complete len:157 (+) Transcript_59235:128-598(+)